MIAGRMCFDWQRNDHYQSKLCIFIDKDNLWLTGITPWESTDIAFPSCVDIAPFIY